MNKTKGRKNNDDHFINILEKQKSKDQNKQFKRIQLRLRVFKNKYLNLLRRKRFQLLKNFGFACNCVTFNLPILLETLVQFAFSLLCVIEILDSFKNGKMLAKLTNINCINHLEKKASSNIAIKSQIRLI